MIKYDTKTVIDQIHFIPFPVNFQKLLLSGNNNMLILPIIDKKLYIDEMARILFVDFEKSANIRKIIVMCVS